MRLSKARSGVCEGGRLMRRAARGQRAALDGPGSRGTGSRAAAAIRSMPAGASALMVAVGLAGPPSVLDPIDRRLVPRFFEREAGGVPRAVMDVRHVEIALRAD